MKILHVIPNLKKGGAERLALDICIELKRQNHEVVLVSFSEENEYQFLSQEINHQVIPSSIQFSIKGKNRYQVSELQNFIDSFQPDVIHSHLFESEAVLSGIQYPSAHYVVHFHDNMPQMRKWQAKTLLNRVLFTNYYERMIIMRKYRERQTSIIAISKDTYHFAQANLPKKTAIHLLFNAINVDRFRNNVDWINREDRAVMIGSLVPKKGQELAIQIISQLKKMGRLFQLDLLGDGVMKRELQTLANELGIKELIHFHGNVDYPENFLSKAKIYLHTAKYEPFGLVLLEAMAAECPVICSDGIGNRDIITNDVNGIIINHRMYTEYAQQFLEIIENKKLRNKLIFNGFKTTELYRIENYCQKVLEIYER